MVTILVNCAKILSMFCGGLKQGLINTWIIVKFKPDGLNNLKKISVKKWIFFRCTDNDGDLDGINIILVLL